MNGDKEKYYRKRIRDTGCNATTEAINKDNNSLRLQILIPALFGLIKHHKGHAGGCTDKTLQV